MRAGVDNRLPPAEVDLQFLLQRVRALHLMDGEVREPLVVRSVGVVCRQASLPRAEVRERPPPVPPISYYDCPLPVLLFMTKKSLPAQYYVLAGAAASQKGRTLGIRVLNASGASRACPSTG